MNKLSIEVRILTEPIRRSGPCMVEVSITNQGKEAVVVNARLAPGYRGSASREVFFEIFRGSTDEVSAVETVLYHRAPADPKSYRPLASGESVSVSFDLFKWYEVSAAGSYQLKALYQADGPFAEPPEGTLGGIHKSKCIPFTVIE